MVALLSALVTALDQITKHMVEKKVPEGTQVEVVKGKVYICNVKNTGAAYGLFADKPGLLALITVVSCVGIVLNFSQIHKEGRFDRGYRISLACIIGGAVGNLLDRITKKRVTDFIHIKFSKHAPVFNLADVFVLVGGAIFFIKSLKDARK